MHTWEIIASVKAQTFFKLISVRPTSLADHLLCCVDFSFRPTMAQAGHQPTKPVRMAERAAAIKTIARTGYVAPDPKIAKPVAPAEASFAKRAQQAEHF